MLLETHGSPHGKERKLTTQFLSSYIVFDQCGQELFGFYILVFLIWYFKKHTNFLARCFTATNFFSCKAGRHFREDSAYPKAHIIIHVKGFLAFLYNTIMCHECMDELNGGSFAVVYYSLWKICSLSTIYRQRQSGFFCTHDTMKKSQGS